MDYTKSAQIKYSYECSDLEMLILSQFLHQRHNTNCIFGSYVYKHRFKHCLLTWQGTASQHTPNTTHFMRLNIHWTYESMGVMNLKQ